MNYHLESSASEILTTSCTQCSGAYSYIVTAALSPTPIIIIVTAKDGRGLIKEVLSLAS